MSVDEYVSSICKLTLSGTGGGTIFTGGGTIFTGGGGIFCEYSNVGSRIF